MSGQFRLPELGFGTRAVHAGQDPDAGSNAVIPAISMSTTFKQFEPGVHKGYEYSRSGNPTRTAFEAAVASLEHGSYGLAFASGSATTVTVTHLLKPGDHILSVNDVYGGTNRYFTKVIKPMGIDITFHNMNAIDEIRDSIRSNTKMIWIETPTNPTLRLVDIRAVAHMTHDHNKDILVVVDNTFMSPYLQNPLLLGADIVVHSVTKYINGHSDTVMGVAVTNNEAIYQRLKFLQNAIGAVPSPFDCFLANRGLKTLHLRMRQHEENANKIARHLQKSTKVVEVIYPGLESHPQHELAKRQQKGFGGMISFRIKGDISNSKRFFNHLKLFALAESLGGVESLAELPAIMTHAGLSSDEKQLLGVTDTLIRLSVGVEDAEDLIADLENALNASAGTVD